MKNLQEMTKTEKRMLLVKGLSALILLLIGLIFVIGTYFYLIFSGIGALFTGQFVRAIAMTCGVYIWHHICELIYILALPMINFIQELELTIKISKLEDNK